jgi:predicted nucleotidyltransferase
MIYTLEQIKELAEPIAKKYKLKSIWIFGSYARGEATDESDVDLLLDFKDSTAKNLRGFINMANEFEQTFNKKVDILSVYNLNSPTMANYFSKFVAIVNNERLKLYEKQRY